MVAAKKLATYDDLFTIPDHHIGEIVAGVLYASPRPAVRHANAASSLGVELDPPFRRGKGGPGGWLILDEPELHLNGDIVVPDLAGWRKSRMSELPSAPSISMSSDWLCEVLSPSTASFDRGTKLKVYAREQVPHVWLVDPLVATLEVLTLDGATYRLSDVFTGDKFIQAAPFDAVEINLGSLWNLG
jgi:Uma2 family endonuclease